MAEFGKGTETAQETSIRAKAGELLARMLYEKDKIIFREVQDGTDAFVVESGRVGVFKTVFGASNRIPSIPPRQRGPAKICSATTISTPHSTICSAAANCPEAFRSR